MTVSTRIARLMTFTVVIAAVVVACGDPEPTVCPSDLRVRYMPAETTLVVGQRFQPRVEYLGCAGTQLLATPIVYRTSDPLVLAVDSATGRATAVAVGRATITADAPAYRAPVEIPVTVR